MENRKDYEKRLGERLEAAYMQEDIGPVMSREEFHRLIQTAEKKKKHRRTMLSLAAACVALCLVCGGFVAGMTMRESASAGKDDETKTVQQGSSVVIGSGVSENDQNVGVSTKTYTNIEDIPEDIRKEIHFLDSDEFELEKVKVVNDTKYKTFNLIYLDENDNSITINEEVSSAHKSIESIIRDFDEEYEYKDLIIYKRKENGSLWYTFQNKQTIYTIIIEMKMENKIEAILNGLCI